MPWYADLELERHGARYIEPELNVALLTGDGGALEWWTDIERTVASFAEFSAPRCRHAAALASTSSCRSCENILAPESRSPPLPPDERRALLERSAAGRRLLEVSALSPLEFVQQEFEHPTVKAGLLFFNGLREVDLRVRGFGHHIAALLASPAKAQMSRGGIGRARARARSRGARKRRRNPPDDASRSASSSKADAPSASRPRQARLIRARHFVASSLNPHQTFLDLLDAALVPREVRERSSASSTICWRRCSRSISICASRRATRRARDRPELAQAFMVILGLDHVDQFHDIVRHHEAGTIPPTVMWGACPTLFDPSAGAARPAHRLHVGEAAVPPARRPGELGRARATRTAAPCWRSGSGTRRTSKTR